MCLWECVFLILQFGLIVHYSEFIVFGALTESDRMSRGEIHNHNSSRKRKR